LKHNIPASQIIGIEIDDNLFNKFDLNINSTLNINYYDFNIESTSYLHFIGNVPFRTPAVSLRTHPLEIKRLCKKYRVSGIREEAVFFILKTLELIENSNKGGRISFIIPKNILTNNSKFFKTFHQILHEKFKVLQIIDLPNNILLDFLTLEKLLGKNKSARIIAGIELGNRLVRKKENLIINSADVFLLMSKYAKSKKEYFVVFYLSVSGSLIHQQIVAIGNSEMVMVDPREIFEPALKLHASAFIMAHNHPSGSLLPSKDDLKFTSRIKQCSEILGIALLDHVIVSKNGFFSMADEKLLDW
jgi:DNA repair protein RadC